MARDIQTVVSGMHFLEGPRWHAGRIWFSDFYSHQVYSAREDGGDLRVEARVAQQPSGMGWLPDGRLLIVSMRERRVLPGAVLAAREQTAGRGRYDRRWLARPPA